MALNQTDLDDISAFADPFTDARIRKIQGRTRIELIRNGRELQYEISPESGTITAKHRKRAYATVRSLLASEEFANISGFMETQRRAFDRHPQKGSIPSYIKLPDGLVRTDGLASLVNSSSEKTRLVLLDGPAGVGKTFQVEQLARLQAANSVSPSTSVPILHISSRGRRLSNFRDVLAATTQDMGAAFGARHVPMLVRHNLLIAAVDGFDELVDADGYEDAWHALKDFIDQIRGGGTVLLAARDTFVEEQELLARIERTDSSISLVMGTIQAVQPEDAKEWLARAPSWKPSDIESQTTNDVLSEGSYALRPVFLRALAEAKGWAGVVETGPRTFLINSLVQREAKLIAQQLGGVTSDQISPALMSLFQEVALEMTARETDSVEVDHLAFLTQYCFEGVLDERQIRKLMHKAGSFSLMEPSWSKDKRKFTHSEVQYYFLGGALIKALEKNVIPSVLRRTALSGEHLEVFAEVFANDESIAKRAAQHLQSALNVEMSADGLRSNAGAILILAFSAGLIDRLDYISAFEAVLAQGSPQGEFVDSTISRLDAAGANLSATKFDNVQIGTLVVDEYTKFGPSKPNVKVIENRGSKQTNTERDPSKIDEIMASHTAQNGSNYAESPLVILLDRVARRAARCFYLREHGDDDEQTVLLKDPHWPLLRKILDELGRIEIKKDKSMHGRPSPLIRVTNPRQLLDRTNPTTLALLNVLIVRGETQ